MRKQLLDLLLCVSIFLAGCAGREVNPIALKIPGDMTPTVELQKVLRRAHQHKVITEDWGTLSWVASKPLGNAEGLTVGRATIKAGQTNPRHRHPKSEEVLYLLKGHLQQRRQGIVMDCKQLKTDIDSYNENFNKSVPIKLLWDFTDDLADLEFEDKHETDEIL